MQTAPCYVPSFWHNNGVWRTDGQTDGIAVASTALAMRRTAMKKFWISAKFWRSYNKLNHAHFLEGGHSAVQIFCILELTVSINVINHNHLMALMAKCLNVLHTLILKKISDNSTVIKCPFLLNSSDTILRLDLRNLSTKTTSSFSSRHRSLGQQMRIKLSDSSRNPLNAWARWLTDCSIIVQCCQ